MKKNIILLLIFTCNFSFSQVNVDSIRVQLLESVEYRKVDTNDITKGFYRFRNTNNLDSYDICLDSLKDLSEYIGVSLIHTTFDSKGRLIKQIGYNKKGEYSLYDFSPIEIRSYNNDSIIIKLFNYKEILTSTEITIKDGLNRDIEVINYGREMKFESRILYQHTLNNDSLYIKYVDLKGELKPNHNGVSCILQIKDTINQKLKAEHFYNSKMKLTDADQDNISSEFLGQLLYSHKVYKEKENNLYIFFYNSKNELVCESDGMFIIK